MWLRGRNPFLYLQSVTKFSRSPWVTQSCVYSDMPQKKKKMAPLQERRMIDQVKLWAKGGDGGNGCTSFHRGRHDRRGKPDGGSGGRGGDVILECTTDVWDFSSLRHHANAKRGGNGSPKNMIGTRGMDKVVLVPVGTVLHLIEGEVPSSVEKKESSEPLDPWDIPGTLNFYSSESSQQSPIEKTMNTTSLTEQTFKKSAQTTQIRFRQPVDKSPAKPVASSFQKTRTCTYHGELGYEINISGSDFEEDLEEKDNIQYNVAELTEPGQRVTVARGGDGGMGSVQLGRRSQRSKESDPNVEVSEDEDQLTLTHGLPGSEAILLLELKSIADVGFVGMPNAGKSTLLGALSRARPTIGDYAFTTLRPNLGNLKYDDLSITVADIPGLIKGAHENRGLGHNFLRHIERTKVLAYVLDLAAAIDGRKGIPPWEQLRDMMLELEFYSEGLSERPSLIVANKIDEAGAEEVYDELKQRVPGVSIFPVCAVLAEGVPELKDALKRLVNGEESGRPKLDSMVLD